MAKANLLCSGELGFESNYFVKLGDGKNGPKLNLLENLELLEGQCDHQPQNRGPNDDLDHDHEDLNDLRLAVTDNSRFSRIKSKSLKRFYLKIRSQL